MQLVGKVLLNLRTKNTKSIIKLMFNVDIK